MEILKTELRALEDKFLLISKNREVWEKRLDLAKKEKDDLMESINTRVEAIDFIERVASEERLEVKDKVESLITSCLHDVYDSSYSIEFSYGIKGSRTAVEVFLVRNCSDGMVIRREIDGFGGGVADTISLPLKLIVLMNDKTFDKILITDEPGKHLDLEKVPRFAKFLKNISEKLGVQIIMSSHHTAMEDYADSVNQITLDGSKSYIERIK